MTAEASRKISPVETADAFGPPDSGAASGKFSATPPDPANMAALLMSMMERMERSERRTASVIGDMQTRLTEMSRQAEEAGAAADEAAARAGSKSRIDTSTFALLEQRLGAFQVPAPDESAFVSETAAPAYRAEAQITFTAANPEPIRARRSEDADRQHGEAPAARPAPAEAVMFAETVTPAVRRSATEPPPANDRHASAPHSVARGEPLASARAEIPLAERFKSGVEAPRKPAMGPAAEPPPLMERRQPQANIGIQNNDERPSGQWPAWRAPCRREAPDADERLAERCRFEDQFEGLAARLESALSTQQSGSEIEALSDKLDAVSRELANALAEPAEALNSIEHQLTDIARSFGNTEQRFQKMNDIESHLAKVLSTLNDSAGMIDRAAESAAARVIERTIPAPNDSLTVRFDAMHAELSAFDNRSRTQADRLSGAIESMQRMLNNLADTKSRPAPASAEPPRVEEKRAASAAPSTADFARPQSSAKLDADFDDEPVHAQSNAAAPRPSEPAPQGSSLRERLGATIPDFQPAAAQQRARQPQSGDHQASGPAEKKDDFIAAARKAAQAAAAKANEKSNPNAQMREPAKQKPSSKGAEAHLSRPRPVLVITAAVLLIASAALLYTRLQSKPAAPSAPAVEQQQGKGKAGEPAKSSNARSESMLALGSPGKEVRKFNDRLGEDAQPAAISRDEAEIGSVVVKSLGDDATTLNTQVALPSAMVGPYSMRLAAARGEMVAQYVVASRFAEGKGVPQDWEEASRWYARAAAQGHAPAQYRLAVLFERGQGVEKDAPRARVWYTRAADQGSLKAMHNLAVTMSGPDATPDDHAIAAQWFAKAAEQGLADSQFNLAIFFENGLGLNRDVGEAYKWYSLAANQMDVEAAKRRDLLKAQLDEKALAAADKALKAWRPVPPKKEANDVEASDATWGETAADL